MFIDNHLPNRLQIVAEIGAIEFGNQNALEKALLKLINDKKLCQSMGEKGVKIVKKNFSSIIINNQTSKINPH